MTQGERDQFDRVFRRAGRIVGKEQGDHDRAD